MSYDMAIWELIRASGLGAYVLLSVVVTIGIALRVRALDWLMKRGWVFEGHQVISVLALALTFVHVALLLLNRHVPFAMTEILVPFASTWRPLASALGTMSLYLVALLVVSSYARPMIGQKTWRAIHFGGFLAWAMALVHGLSAGSDATAAWVQYLYLGTGSTVVFLTLFRVLEGSRPRISIPQAPTPPPHSPDYPQAHGQPPTECAAAESTH